MADRKDRMALLSRFDKHYKDKYGAKPSYNMWAEQWAADALIESYTLEMCYDLLEYYFENATNPEWKYFSNFTDQILLNRKLSEQDRLDRIERRKKAKEWLNG
jgi:hypothetical protein